MSGRRTRPDDESMLTVDELAELLNVTVATIYYWRALRQGPRGQRVGRYIRFRRADVERWLEQQADSW